MKEIVFMELFRFEWLMPIGCKRYGKSDLMNDGVFIISYLSSLVKRKQILLSLILTWFNQSICLCFSLFKYFYLMGLALNLYNDIWLFSFDLI